MTAQVPVCHLAGAGSATNKNAVAGIALRSNLFSEVAHIDLRCGGGHGSVMSFIAAEAEGPPHPAIAKRRRILRVSIFRNMAACRDEFTATNTRTDNTKMVMVRIPCQVVQCHAQPDATLADIWGTWSPPAANVRLWQFGNIAITSYNGMHGTVCGSGEMASRRAASLDLQSPGSCRYAAAAVGSRQAGGCAHSPVMIRTPVLS